MHGQRAPPPSAATTPEVDIGRKQRLRSESGLPGWMRSVTQCGRPSGGRKPPFNNTDQTYATNHDELHSRDDDDFDDTSSVSTTVSSEMNADLPRYFPGSLLVRIFCCRFARYLGKAWQGAEKRGGTAAQSPSKDGPCVGDLRSGGGGFSKRGCSGGSQVGSGGSSQGRSSGRSRGQRGKYSHQTKGKVGGTKGSCGGAVGATC